MVASEYITNEITWFNPKYDLPKDGETVIVCLYPDIRVPNLDEVKTDFDIVTYKRRQELDKWCGNVYNYHTNCIKYWGYLFRPDHIA